MDCSVACFRRRIKAEALANRSSELTGIDRD
jgi:hypothetical protein